MGDIVTMNCDQFDEQRRLVLVDQKPHAGWRSGSSPSCTASAAYLRQICMLIEDLIDGHSVSDHRDH